MEQKVLQKLEYLKIREMLAEQCSTRLGRDLAEELLPAADYDEICLRQQETSEAKEILRLFPGFSLGGVHDLRDALRKAEVGGLIEPGEFLQIYDTLGAAKRIKAFFAADGKAYENLAGLAQGLAALGGLEQQIKKTITVEGEVSDNASAELARVRRQLRGLQGKVRDKLESMVRSSEMQKYLQDALITIRKDRYVIPVKVEYRAQVPGLIHDQSASGATIFVEPMAVVELNNETQRLEAMEKAEVARILRWLTQSVFAQLEELQQNLSILSRLDFISAKGKLSNLLDAGRPELNTRGFLSIIQGRHPLIQGRVVPITIHLGRDFDTLVITGPNTGGKTVTLKTVGLFVLMAQAGLHVPAQAGTELCVFGQVFADIGDEQSIEQSLSTFSSHMTNIIDILRQVDGRSLVLLDELGAGTDPAEGAALAMSILEHLIATGAKTVATTHYSELKSFAYKNERVENASVEFDVETLRPTYRLLIGVPGKSNAFEISGRLGLQPEVINRARSFLSREEMRVADLIENLETNQLLSEKDRQEAEKMKRLAQAKLVQLEQKEQELKAKAQAVLHKAQAEALEIVMRARRESEAVLKEIRSLERQQDRTAQQDLEELRNKLKEQESILEEEVYQEEEHGEIDPALLMPGDLVLIKRLNQKAQVLARPGSDGEVTVQAGIMKLTVKVRDLSWAEGERPEKRRQRTGAGEIYASKAREIRNELDLRGMTVYEALAATEKYLDDAILSGLPTATIIHGKGTGALRSAVSELLKGHRLVESSRLGGYHEGGAGVTVVEFKK